VRLAREGQVWGRLFASRAKKKTPFDNGQSETEAIRRPLPSLIGQAHGTPHKRLAYTLPIHLSVQQSTLLLPSTTTTTYYSSYTTIRVRLNKFKIDLSRSSKQRHLAQQILSKTQRQARTTLQLQQATAASYSYTRPRPFFGTLSLARF
jgi:hypothetical protein